MEIVMRKTDELIPYINNARKNDNAVESVASSIKNFGFKQPIVIDGQGEVVAGHTRLKAAKKLGLKEVPVIVADDLTPAQIKAYRIADNRVGELAEWDMELLQLELADIEDFTGFEELDLPDDEPKGNDDDFDAYEELEQIEDPITQRGWIYNLGNHRLMCGDSTSEEDVRRLMDGQYADCVFTDPPYLIETKGGKKGRLSKELQKQGESIEFIANFNPVNFLVTLPLVFSKNFNAYIFCNKELLPDYLLWAREKKISFNVLIWKKPISMPIGASHRPDIEYLILFRRNAIWNNGLKNVNYSRCLEYGKEKGFHPTMKPIELIVNELKISSNVNSNVVDFFGGSGSTLIACEQIKRNCFMMEIEAKYCDVIVKRWENATGKRAERIE